MATWKKVVVSGSTANLANLQVDGLTNNEVVIGGGSGNLSSTAISGSGNILAQTGASNVVISGSFSGSFEGDGSNLTGIVATTLDIDAFGSDLTSATLASGDKFIVSDNGTEGRANISQLATPLAGNGLSGSNELNVEASGSSLTVDSNGVGIAAGGVLTSHIGSDAVTDAKIADEAVGEEHLQTSVAGNGLTGGAGSALSIDVSGSSLNVDSNGVGIAAGGVLNSHIGTDAVNGAKIADNAIDSEHITVGAIDGVHLATGSVNSDALASSGVTAGTYGSTTAVPRFVVDTDGRITSSSTVAIATSFDIAADNGSNDTVAGGETLTFAGADGGIATTVSDNTITINSVGLVSASAVAEGDSQGQIKVNGTNINTNALGTNDSPEFAGLTVSGNAQVTGDLTVQGTTTSIQTANLNVEDQFILLHSGSGTGDQGLVFSSGSSGDTGAAFFYDVAKDRLSYATGSISWNATAAVPSAYVALVVDTEDSQDDSDTKVAKRGNIKVDANDAYIYV